MTFHFTAPVPLDVITMFEKLTMDVQRAGYQHYSADAILHRIRWHFRVEQGLREFKCNNNWTAELARWFMDKHPHMNGFFRTRMRRRFGATP